MGRYSTAGSRQGEKIAASTGKSPQPKKLGQSAGRKCSECITAGEKSKNRAAFSRPRRDHGHSRAGTRGHRGVALVSPEVSTTAPKFQIRDITFGWHGLGGTATWPCSLTFVHAHADEGIPH